MRAPFSGILTGPVLQAPPQPSTLGRNLGVTLGLAIVLGLAARVIELRPLELLRDIGNVGLFVKGYLNPSFNHIGVYAWQCVVTVCIALWGTLLAIVIAVPPPARAARSTWRETAPSPTC
jgi:ABC-type phosphate/phosphonate transport system permease subunit